jgi:hypothetical protein
MSAHRSARRICCGPGADRAWAVDLAAAGLDDGEDLTGWFVKYGRSAADLRRLLNRRAS